MLQRHFMKQTKKKSSNEHLFASDFNIDLRPAVAAMDEDHSSAVRDPYQIASPPSPASTQCSETISSGEGGSEPTIVPDSFIQEVLHECVSRFICFIFVFSFQVHNIPERCGSSNFSQPKHDVIQQKLRSK